MQRVFVKRLILIFSMQMVFGGDSHQNCPLYSWQCNNGQCIEYNELCDGNYDCDDKSDETVETCLLRPCPGYAFQCAYGACITGTFKCDGVINCVDGSDETRYLCNPKLKYEAEIQGNCGLPNSVQCKSGECIKSESLCDGRIDCLDGSDETVEACSFLHCPTYAFRCGYGACITGSAACDGIIDCKDGSDEIANICLSNTSTGEITDRPTPQASTSTTVKSTILTTSTATTLYPASSEKPFILSNYCPSTTLLRGISTVASCFYQDHPVSCHLNIRAGTTATVSCASGYVEKHLKRNFPSMKCDSDGEWTRPKRKCMPECGTLTDEQKDSLSKPWEVTILRRDFAPTYLPVCSGVIVSPKVVLTAASCFPIYNGSYYTNHVSYGLVEGFYNRTYSNGDHLSAKAHNISSICIKSIHRTHDLAILVLVDYFQFSSSLKPICLPTAQSNVFPLYSDFKLNIGRPVTRDTQRVYLEYLIAAVDYKSNGRKSLSYVNIYLFIPFINRETRKYDYLL